ncbi:MAG: hypothetical protein M1832_006310 [Thelocarpon impressellum]|nr:MAG: hypothetical protein M1832_006310 [Thelocarpon impressellum]
MEVAEQGELLLGLLDRLGDDVDGLDDALRPLLDRSLPETVARLPLLDKAKLYLLLTYALESAIFCTAVVPGAAELTSAATLRLHGIDARAHPVYRELARLRQYFEKVKALETTKDERPASLDRPAAGRVIKHALAGNDRLDLERAERLAKEKAKAHVRKPRKRASEAAADK